LGQLQETLEELKWMVELKNQEAPGLLEQWDQCLAHLQQHVVACKQMSSQKEALLQQLLMQTQLLDQ
jgi:hypothetical protein